MFLALAVLAASAHSVRGQSHQLDRQRLARAEQLSDSLREVDSAEASRQQARADVGDDGPVRVIISAGGGSARLVAQDVWKTWRGFGIPKSVLSRFVLVEEGVSQRGATINHRKAIIFNRPGGLAGNDKRFASFMADNASWSLSGALLDSTMSLFLDDHFDPRVSAGSENALAIADLKQGRWRSGRRCLSGSAADCVVYLGIEEHPDARVRYPIADIRQAIIARAVPLTNMYKSCVDGDDSACAGIWREGDHAPSNTSGRWSFVVFLRERYGSQVLPSVLADTAASVGARLRHATGQSPLELAAAWRDWLLPPAQRWPVAAGALQAGSSLFIVMVLLFAAARSDMWLD